MGQISGSGSLYNVFGYVADLGLASSLSLAGSGSGPRPHTCIVSQSSEYYTNSQPEFRILYQQSVREQNIIQPKQSVSVQNIIQPKESVRVQNIIQPKESVRVQNIIPTASQSSEYYTCIVSQSSEYYTNSKPEFRILYLRSR